MKKKFKYIKLLGLFRIKNPVLKRFFERHLTEMDEFDAEFEKTQSRVRKEIENAPRQPKGKPIDL